MFLPTTPEELAALGWDVLDVILVTGDTYIDHPSSGTAVIGKILHSAGYRVGIIAQPDITSPAEITRLGEPRLFWGVTGGCVDSMVANYTATKRKRKSDDYTPGGENNRRPDRAVIVYANAIRKYFKTTRPIVLGGIEASLRRVAHYEGIGRHVPGHHAASCDHRILADGDARQYHRARAQRCPCPHHGRREPALVAIALGGLRKPGRSGVQVVGELHPLELQAQRDRQCMRQRGLADAGQVFDQQVTAGQQTGQRQADLWLFADHHRADLRGYRLNLLEHAFLT